MGLIKSKGNMYEFITHQWNPIKGRCWHDCSYCYMKKWGEQKPIRLDEKEFKTNLGSGNFIFICSGCDLFADGVKREWIIKTIKYANSFDNKYLYQTKNPFRMTNYLEFMERKKSVICITLETNKYYEEYMGNCPTPFKRYKAFRQIKGFKKYITIEPIMDFDLEIFADWIELCKPVQVNIGADSMRNNLPEPSYDKVLDLEEEFIKSGIKTHHKKNTKRLFKLLYEEIEKYKHL